MKAVAALCFALLVSSAYADIADYDVDDDGVLVLDEKTFDSAIEEFNPLLVEFYAPWCGHCKRLAPEYGAAAKQLEEDGLYLAKVDATAERSLGDRYGVQGFPTLKFFKGGKATEYGGGRTEKEIVQWVRKKSGPATKQLATAEDAQAFIDSADVVAIGFFSDAASDEAKAFETVASGNDDVAFGVVSDAGVASGFDKSMDSVTVFKNFEGDAPEASYDGSLTDKDALAAFVAGNSLPTVIPFSQDIAPRIFGGPTKVHFLLFADTASSEFDDLAEQFRDTAEANRGQLLAITVGLDNARVMEYFGVQEGDLPAAVIVNMPDGQQMKKFMYDADERGALARDTMKDFAAAYFSGDLKPFLKSEDVPASQDEAVITVVGKNFEEVVLDDSKDVLLEFYAPWCGHCKALAPKYDELAEKLSSVEHIVIAKMDATANEVDHPDVDVRGFPTLKFFPANGGSVIDYDGEREVDAFITFLKQHSTTEFSLDDDAEL